MLLNYRILVVLGHPVYMSENFHLNSAVSHIRYGSLRNRRVVRTDILRFMSKHFEKLVVPDHAPPL